MECAIVSVEIYCNVYINKINLPVFGYIFYRTKYIVIQPLSSYAGHKSGFAKFIKCNRGQIMYLPSSHNILQNNASVSSHLNFEIL